MRVEVLDALDIANRLHVVVKPAEAERAHVDGGRGRAKDEDEADQVFDIPPRRHSEVFRVHVVPRDAGLRDIVEQVLDEDLGGGHGAERQPAGGDEDAEDVAEVGRRDHFDIFDAALMSVLTAFRAMRGKAERRQERGAYVLP